MNLQNLILMVVMVAAFWFLLIRPQQQRQKKQAAMIAALKPGARIVTIGGMFGTVVEADERVLIEVADGTRIEFAPQAISQVLEPSDEAEDSSQAEEEAEQADAASDEPGVLEPVSDADEDAAAGDTVDAETSPHA